MLIDGKKIHIRFLFFYGFLLSLYDGIAIERLIFLGLVLEELLDVYMPTRIKIHYTHYPLLFFVVHCSYNLYTRDSYFYNYCEALNRYILTESLSIYYTAFSISLYQKLFEQQVRTLFFVRAVEEKCKIEL